MKNLISSVSLCLFTFILAGCASTGINVASDKKSEADISEFKTFNWVSDVGEIPDDQVFIGPEGVLIFNNISTRSVIQEAIQTELEAKGFTRDTNNPDMLASFKVMEQDGQLRTYISQGNRFLAAGPVERDVEMVDVEAGTVLVNFIDGDTGIQVWQGFASGALEESDVEDEKILQAKVSAIFNEFDFSAFEISSGPAAG